MLVNVVLTTIFFNMILIIVLYIENCYKNLKKIKILRENLLKLPC